MWIPILCFVVASLLLIMLIVINVKAQSSASKAEQEQTIASEPAKEAVEQIEEAPLEQNVVDSAVKSDIVQAKSIQEEVTEEIPTSNNEAANDFKPQTTTQTAKADIMHDSSYRAALMKFQNKKPELAEKKRKSTLSDSDYRNALKAMQQQSDKKE